MAKKTIEVEVGTKPAGDTPAKVGTTHPAPEPEAEVGGRAIVRRLMECAHCGNLSWIWYDTEDYHAYTCCHCGGTNIL